MTEPTASTMPHAPTASRWLPRLIGCLALIAIAVAVWQLERAGAGVAVTAQRVGTTPVTVFRPAVASSIAAPVVLIAHGFAGSQQLMQPFALTLARNGFVAITFDFPGHGRNVAPLRGGLADHDESLRVLLASMQAMGAFARETALQESGTGQYAVIGHSMGSDIVVRHAQANDDVQATVAVSLFAPSIGAGTPGNSPRNLLVIDGALEPDMLAKEALRVVGRVAGPDPAPATTYGSFKDGTARRATLSPGTEHIGVLYSPATQAETLAWLDAAFGRAARRDAFIDARGPSLGLLLAGVVTLAWPLSRWLPRVRPAAPPVDRPVAGRVAPMRRRWWAWRGQAPLTLVPALLTPLLLWKMPTDFLPILLGDYLMLHFALYGVLTFALLWATGARPPRVSPAGRAAFATAILLACAYALLAVGVPVDRYIFNMRPETVRLALIAALCIGTLPYFVADEWLTRGAAAAPGAYVASKFAFLFSLVLAIAANPGRLFFLALIVPVVLLLFVIYGLFSRWTCRATDHPAVAATANALAFAWFIAVTFPLVA